MPLEDQASIELTKTGAKPTPDDILMLTRENAIVHAAVDLWRRGLLSWDQAMIGCIVALAEQNSQLMQRLEKALMWSPSGERNAT